MVEFLMLLQGQAMLGEIFSPLFRHAAPPLWWYYGSDGNRNRDSIMRRILGGDNLLSRDPEWLFAELPRHIKRGLRIANAILRDPFDAEEAVANALIKTDSVPYVPENFGAYFDRAVRNASFDILRQRSLRPPTISLEDVTLHSELNHFLPTPEQEVSDSQIGSILHDAIAQLSLVEQKAVMLHYFEEFSISKTSDALGQTVFFTQNLLTRARKKLRAILASQLGRHPLGASGALLATKSKIS